MFNLLISLAIAASFCPETKVVNKTNEWTERDQSTLDSCKERCKVKYEHSPCLKYFEKYDFQAYHAVCGAEKKEDKVKGRKRK